jgi:hypothetical protein
VPGNFFIEKKVEKYIYLIYNYTLKPKPGGFGRLGASQFFDWHDAAEGSHFCRGTWGT